MYNVSQAYRVASQLTSQRHKVELRLSNPLVAASVPITLTDDHIEAGTLEVVNQCSDQKDLTPGAVYIGQMSVTIANTTPYISPLMRGQWVGGLIQLTFKLLVDEEQDIWESVPVGFFEISSATWTEKGVKVVAYDYMNKFDKALRHEMFVGIPWQIIDAICRDCGVGFGQSKYDVQYFPNANEILAIMPESGISTYREMLSAIVQCVGGFATIGRDGMLYIRRFGNVEQPTATFDADHRYDGAKFSDYVTKYTRLTDGQDEDGNIYEWGDSTGATISFGGNPFLTSDNEAVRNRQHMAILNEIKNWKYVPFTATVLCGVEYDLGDIINFVGGIAGITSVGIINKYVWKYKKGYTMSGFGANPKLASYSSGKGSGSGSGKSGGSLIRYFRVENLGELSWMADGIDHAEDEKLVGVIDFVSSGDNVTELWSQIQLHALTWTAALDSAHIITRAYMDDELIAEVIDTLEAPRVVTDDIPFYETILASDTVEARPHRLKVTVQILDCWDGPTWTDFFIDVGGFRATLKGQGLTEESEWDGNFKFEDTVSGVNVEIVAPELTDEFKGFTMLTPIPVSLSETGELGQRASISIEGITEGDFAIIKSLDPKWPICGDGFIMNNNELL